MPRSAWWQPPRGRRDATPGAHRRPKRRRHRVEVALVALVVGALLAVGLALALSTTYR